jgi:membrane carboxypeptidase/penicillin-binding protein PbpC
LGRRRQFWRDAGVDYYILMTVLIEQIATKKVKLAGASTATSGI